MVKDIRYIIKKVIIGVLIGIALIMFKSYKVNALTTISDSVVANSYYQTQYCTPGSTITSGIQYNCTTGPSMKFSQYLNNDENISVPALINSGQLINNFSYEILFENPITISSTDRYLVLQPPFVKNSSSYSNDSTFNVQFTGALTLNGIKNGSSVSNSPATSVFGISPKYCSYYDSNNQLQYCNVSIVLNTSLPSLLYYIDIPVGTSFTRVNLYFGHKDLSSTYDIKYDKVYGEYYPLSNNWDSRGWNSSSYCSTSYSNFWCNAITWENYKTYYNSNDYNVKRGFSDRIGAGLIHYYYAPYDTKFNPSNLTQNLWLDSSIGTTNIITTSFNNVSSEDTTYYDNLMGTINQELNPGGSTGTDTSFFNDFLEGYTTSSSASGLLSLFNNMFLYPMQKLQSNAQLDLVTTNIHNDKVLSSTLCEKNPSSAIVGDPYTPYQVQFYRDYKFNLPCPHSEIYTQLKYGEYGFYSNSFLGASVNTGVSYSFASIWLTIQHGFLVYILFVNCLNIYKYVLDSNKTEIEVLEL